MKDKNMCEAKLIIMSLKINERTKNKLILVKEITTPTKISKIMKYQKVKYARFVCDYSPKKLEPYLCQITVRGDKVEYTSEVLIKNVDITIIKLLFKIILSMAREMFLKADISFFSHHIMDQPKYTRIKTK